MTTTSDNKFSAASSAVSILLGVELKASESSGFLPPKGHQDELFRSRLESEEPSATLSALSFSGVGYGQAIATSSVVSYYTCLIAMSVFYLIASCQSVLPWTVCDPEIVLNNTICVGTGQNATQLLADGGNFHLFIYFFF